VNLSNHVINQILFQLLILLSQHDQKQRVDQQPEIRQAKVIIAKLFGRGST
jgi:hypothetical protein